MTLMTLQEIAPLRKRGRKWGIPLVEPSWKPVRGMRNAAPGVKVVMLRQESNILVLGNPFKYSVPKMPLPGVSWWIPHTVIVTTRDDGDYIGSEAPLNILVYHNYPKPYTLNPKPYTTIWFMMD